MPKISKFYFSSHIYLSHPNKPKKILLSMYYFIKFKQTNKENKEDYKTWYTLYTLVFIDRKRKVDSHRQYKFHQATFNISVNPHFSSIIRKVFVSLMGSKICCKERQETFKKLQMGKLLNKGFRTKKKGFFNYKCDFHQEQQLISD